MTYFISDTEEGVGVMGTGSVVVVGMLVWKGWGVRGHWSAGISDCGQLVCYYMYKINHTCWKTMSKEFMQRSG